MDVTYTHIRGGTSKALFFRTGDLPPDNTTRDLIFCEALGSPDPYARQLNGLGAGTSSTNKVAIITPSSDPNADVDFEFVQVGIREATTSRQGTCGNISSGVGPYAVWAGLVQATGDRAVVRVRNTNTNKLFTCTFPVGVDGLPRLGLTKIAGVSGGGVPVDVSFVDPAGAISGELLPTGAPQTCISVGDGHVQWFSLIDSANPVVFLSAHNLSVDLDNLSLEDSRIAYILRTIRRHCAVTLGLASSVETADMESPLLPLVSIVDRPNAYITSAGAVVDENAYTIRSTMISMGMVHGSHPFTGAIATALAACTDGTIVNELCTEPMASELRIGHPAGILAVRMGRRDGKLVIEGARSARRLARGLLSIDSLNAF